ncbi:MAG TPA: tripartite tricarboxylate transporter substrate binding protein [Burkholderiales bacterium]|nr:tripartite tricarboxylate transporter substrate binding protein [Burkholderiales bacterium]
MKLIRTVLLVCTAMVACVAHAQYPSKPVRIVMPYAAGGTGDILIRILAQKLTQSTGNAFVVENKPGAVGKIGYQMIASAAPDGYSLVAADGAYAMLPALNKSLAWHFDTDLIPVTIYADTPFVLVVSAASGINTLPELIARAKANPGKLNYGSSGTGGSTHVLTEMFKQKASISMTHVPYKGSGDAVVGLLGGSIDMMFTSVPTAMAQIKAGKFKALAVTGKTRVSALPSVPTAIETGLDFDSSNWYGILAPHGTPSSVIEYLQQKIAGALQTAEVREAFAAQGAEPIIMTTSEFDRILRGDVERWRSIIRTAGITIE